MGNNGRKGTYNTVSSADMIRNFGYWQDKAVQGPLTITHHGRPRYVLMSTDLWSASQDAEQASDDRPDKRHVEFDLLVDMIEGGFLVADADLVVRQASKTAALLLMETAETLIGSRIDTVLGTIGAIGAVAGLHRVLDIGEESQFDLPLADRPGMRMRGRALPWTEGLALLFHVYHDHALDKQLVEQSALEQARAAHGAISIVRLTVRGTIESVEPLLAALLAMVPERLQGIRFVDLVSRSDRTAVRDAIEQVLGGKVRATALDCQLLSNDGAELRVRIAIAALVDGYAVSGATLIVTVTSQTH